MCRCFGFVLLGIGLWAHVPAGRAAVAVVDSSQSYAQWVPSGGETFEPQAPGSDRTTMRGTVQIEITDDSISFLSGSSIFLDTQSEFFVPNLPHVNLAIQTRDELGNLNGFATGNDISFGVLKSSIPLNPDGTFDAHEMLVRTYTGKYYPSRHHRTPTCSFFTWMVTTFPQAICPEKSLGWEVADTKSCCLCSSTHW